MRLDEAITMAVRRLPLVIALLAFWAGSSRADFIDGLEAYDGGDYETVLAEWRPLAEAGDPEAQVALAGLTSATLLDSALFVPQRGALVLVGSVFLIGYFQGGERTQLILSLVCLATMIATLGIVMFEPGAIARW